jgi:RNA polymerase sigma factor (sigma-70 family)
MSRVEPPDLPPDLIERALDGERAAFCSFYKRYDPTVRWAVGLRIYRWPELNPDLEDIVQEVWCELMRRKGKRLRYHDRTRGLPFWRFLAFVATRLAWRIAKRRLGHPTVEMIDVLDEEGEGFARKLMNTDFAERFVELARKRLDDKEWDLFVGYYVRGEQIKVVGERLQLRENTTYKRMERLRGKLQALAEELLGESPAKTPPEHVAVILAMVLELAQSGLGGGA